jgi:hypothetical protein
VLGHSDSSAAERRKMEALQEELVERFSASLKQ